MEHRHLRYFVAVVDCGSVSAAAARVNITQPALSRQLQQLERELQVSLFDRAGGRLTLSRTGQELLPRARSVLAEADALRADAAFHAAGGLRRVRIAAPTVTLTDVVSPFVATMSTDDPVVDVRSGDGLTTSDMLDAGADLAIGTQTTHPPFHWRELAVLPVWAYVRADDVWADRSQITLDQLSQRPVVGLPGTFTAREALDAAVSAAATPLGEVLEAANGTIAQALAAAGRGVAVVSDDSRFGLRPLTITIGEDVLAVRLVVAWDPRDLAADYVAQLADRLSVWVARQYGQRPPPTSTTS